MPAKEKNQLRRFILDSVPVAIVTMAYDFKITSFNDRAEELTGYSAREAIGRLCHEVFHCSRCKNGCPVQTVHRNKKSALGLEAEIVNRSDEIIPVRIGVAVLEDEENEFSGYVEVIEDISRQKKIEREKNNFLAMIVHDMKSPLFGIRGLIARLKKEKSCETNEKMQEYFRVIGAAEERLESMVQEFQEYSGLESGHVKLDLGETDIKNVLQQAAEMHRLAAEKQEIVLRYDCTSLAAIEADENRLHRVFNNIIENAIKYSPKKAEVTISASETDKEIVIHFQDQGWGIRPEEIPYIFEAFYRAESKEKIRGQGLGLAASSAIIRQHGGNISVESKPGKGSVFTVRLPKQKKPAPA